MKKLLTILFLFVACAVRAQYIPNAQANQWKGGKFVQSLQPPTACGDPVTAIHAPDSSFSAFYFDSCSNSLWRFNPVPKTWAKEIGGIDSLYIFISSTDSIFIVSGNDTIFIGGDSSAKVQNFAKNANQDSIILTLTDGTRYAVKDSIGSGGAGGGSGTIVIFNNIAELSTTPVDSTTNYAIVLGYYSANDGGGGEFQWYPVSSATLIKGMVIPIGSGYWQRITGNTYNLKWFGAKGIGISGYQEDTAALHAAYGYIRTKGHGNLYVPASDSAYCWAGLGSLSPNNFNMYGDGVGKTKWLYINSNFQPDYLNGTFLFFGTFATYPGANMTRTPRYQIFDVAQGATVAKLRVAGDAANFQAGEIIKLSGRAYNKDNEAGKTIWRNNAFVQVTRISNDSLYFDHPAAMDILRDDPAYALYEVTNGITTATDTGSAVVFRPNSGTTTHAELGVTDQMGYNISVHDMSFDVSPFDYITNTWYDSSIIRRPGNIFSLGSAYKLNLYNLEMNAYGILGGQYFSNFQWSNISVQSARKAFDFGNESSEGVINGMRFQYKNEFYDTANTAMMYINNHSHHIVIKNILMSGAYSGNNIIQNEGGVHDMVYSDMNFDLPNYSGGTGDAIHIVTDDTVKYTYPENINFNNITFNLHQARRYISYIGQPHSDFNYNGIVSFRDLIFTGSANLANPILFNNADSIYADNIQTNSEDDITIQNTTYLRNLSVAGGSGAQIRVDSVTVTLSGLDATEIINLTRTGFKNIEIQPESGSASGFVTAFNDIQAVLRWQVAVKGTFKFYIIYYF